MSPTRYMFALVAVVGIAMITVIGWATTRSSSAANGDRAACVALASSVRNLTIVSADLRPLADSTTQYCYVKGLVAPGIQYHVQLPLPENWNGRFLKWGDGGKDGGLNFADHRVAQGYVVANSNSGHDGGSEPGASFGWNNRQSEIDFGYRAVHLTVNAAKTLLRAYYGKAQEYSYFEGCSTGGRQGLMEAQRFPHDFDGIVAGDPVNYYTQTNIAEVWNIQRVYADDLAKGLSYDTDGDAKPDSLTKLNMLHEAVLSKCDTIDGVKDGVIDHPPACQFDPDVDLASMMCRNDVNADDCFTKGQLQAIKDFYRGPHDSKGNWVFHGLSVGSEWDWGDRYYPSPANNFRPTHIAGDHDHLNFLFYDNDPGLPPPDPLDVKYEPDNTKNPPEWAWWHFNVDDFTAGKGKVMMSILDATDPDLTRFLKNNNGRLILYHGWADGSVPPEGTVTYYKGVVETTFQGDMTDAGERIRLFMVPGMGHCRGGPGPNDWDKLAPLVKWVENGTAPAFVVATHRSDQEVQNERPVCAYPQRAAYTGPTGGQNDPAHWVARNFTCR